ncbi:MAG: AI-2E family transporter [Thermoanaerobaculia bacterium]
MIPAPQRFRRAFLMALALFVSALFLYMIRAYLLPIFLAAVSAGLATPLFERILRRIGARRSLAAALTITILFLAIALPLAGFVGVVTAAGVDVASKAVPWVKQAVQEPGELVERAYAAVPRLRELEPYRSEILARAGDAMQKLGNAFVKNLSAITGGTLRSILGLFVLLYAMFFFLIGGRSLLDGVLAFLPLPAADKERLVGRFLSVAKATLKGTLVVGLVQAILAGVAFAVVGIGGSAFWATLVFVLSVVPGIGAPLVWVPIAIYLASTGHGTAALGLSVWCAVVVGTIDNLLRPRLVGGDTKMPDLLILVSTLGGISLFGAAGLIVGPIVAALFLTVWEIFGTAFQDVLADERDSAPAADSAGPD